MKPKPLNDYKEVKMDTEEKKEFKVCSTCKGKIGFFRRRAAKKQDKSGKYPIIQAQFCSPKCAEIGYHIYLEVNETQLRERANAIKIIDKALDMISKKRREMLDEYGSVEEIPPHQMPLLYSGAYRLLQTIREQIKYGDTKKENKF